MQPSERGIALIKEFEQLRLEPYDDGFGNLTVGWGHRTMSTDAISEAQAEAYFADDLANAMSAVSDLVHAHLTQGQFDALTSFTFNLGRGALARSTMRKLLNAGMHWLVPGELRKYVNAGGHRVAGLVRRREAEIALWESDSKMT